MSINPNWPYITLIALLLAAAYAALIAWMNGHRRNGAFWRAHAWLEVVVGNGLIALTAWALAGLNAFLLLLALDCLWGIPMIIACLLSNMRRVATAIERAEAERMQAEVRGR